MTKQAWLEKVRQNLPDLLSLIDRYHPVNRRPRRDDESMLDSPMPITAVQAERACEVVRGLIRKVSLDRPDVRLNTALQNQDYGAIAALLSEAWFGVPESTDCWRIPGFSVAVDLMDDPVENSQTHEPI